MSIVRYLAIVSMLLTLPVSCFGQYAASPVPAYNSGYQYSQQQIMPVNYGRIANPMAQAVAPDANHPAHLPPQASNAPVQMAAPAPMSATNGNMGVGSSFSDFGSAMSAPMNSYDAGGESYFDAGGCGSGDCGSAVAGCCDTDACCGGKYFSIFGGMADLDSQRSTGFQRDLNIQFEQGYALGGAVGRRVGRNLRAEMEYCYRSQDPGNLVFNGNSYQNLSGNQNCHAGMLNLVFDMIIGHGNLVPYVGAGVGIGSIDSSVQFQQGVLDGDDSALALQWMAGLSYRCKPNMEIFCEYRHFELDDPKLNYFGGPQVNIYTPNILLNSEYKSSDVFAGFRFNF